MPGELVHSRYGRWYPGDRVSRPVAIKVNARAHTDGITHITNSAHGGNQRKPDLTLKHENLTFFGAVTSGVRGEPRGKYGYCFSSSWRRICTAAGIAFSRSEFLRSDDKTLHLHHFPAKTVFTTCHGSVETFQLQQHVSTQSLLRAGMEAVLPADIPHTRGHQRRIHGPNISVV
ncbi:hypothetical protein Bbelb_037480 [Branchiostoma belcheri]|nr:hypothetical protein Bbelb_037480 [Branchiostoma belcheri]